MSTDRSIVSFDIEISDVLPKDASLEDHFPVHPSCGATSIYKGRSLHWNSWDPDAGRPTVDMTAETAWCMLNYLRQKQREGAMVCAWNGASFDLQWLAHASNSWSLAREIALDLYDPMFQFFNQRGFPVSLASVVDGMGVPGSKLMDGADAPQEWRDGDWAQVIAYCIGDCQLTNNVVAQIVRRGLVAWRTKKGSVSVEPMKHLKTVREVLEDPLPDQSWMDEPIPREKFVGWIINPAETSDEEAAA